MMLSMSHFSVVAVSKLESFKESITKRFGWERYMKKNFLVERV